MEFLQGAGCIIFRVTDLLTCMHTTHRIALEGFDDSDFVRRRDHPFDNAIAFDALDAIRDLIRVRDVNSGDLGMGRQLDGPSVVSNTALNWLLFRRLEFTSLAHFGP